MIVLRPRLHSLLAIEESRTTAQLEALGVAPEASTPPGHALELSLGPEPGPARRLLAAALLDYAIRLDPLVAEVRLEGFERAMIDELAPRFPFEESGSAAASRPVFSVAIGAPGPNADLRLDASGWLASLGYPLEPPGPGLLNPIGPLAAATLAAAEIFKALFVDSFPDARYAARFTLATGVFSFFDYAPNCANPAIEPIEIDAHLVGLGGVGAGIIRALAALGTGLHGHLALIDHDPLDLHNLNRVTYATIAAARTKDLKVDVAEAYLSAHAPNLRTTPHPQRFDQYKMSISRTRRERRYEVVLTALDDDEVRHAVQRELPRVLIDGATGRDLNMTVERVLFGKWACLGCTRQNPPATSPAGEGEGCGNIADPRAPSVSFLSALPGILAAGELIKEALGAAASLRGSFNHIFIYGLNPELRNESAQRDDCRVGCKSPSWQAEYRIKNQI